MAFSAGLKLKVRRRSAFQCCRCREIGVEIHHIVPQADGGPDDEDNAAPLCPNCHTWFGANPEKRTEIRQMRDWWFEVCDEKYGGNSLPVEQKLDELLGQLRATDRRGAEHERLLAEVNDALLDLKESQALKGTDSAAAIAAKVSSIVSATRLGDNVYANFVCRNCGTMVGLLVGSSSCPTCGTPIPR